MPRIWPSLALFFVASSQDFDGELLRDEDYVVEGSHGTNQTHQCTRARAHTHTHARRSLRCGRLAHCVDSLRRDTRVTRRSVTTTVQPFQCHILATAAFAHCAQFEVTRAGRTLCGRSASPPSRPQTLLVSGCAASYRARMCAWRSTFVARREAHANPADSRVLPVVPPTRTIGRLGWTAVTQMRSA